MSTSGDAYVYVPEYATVPVPVHAAEPRSSAKNNFLMPRISASRVPA
jgi:hypothetical protein